MKWNHAAAIVGMALAVLSVIVAITYPSQTASAIAASIIFLSENLTLMIALFGAIGGVPTLSRFLKERPELELSEPSLTYRRTPNFQDECLVRIKVKNRKRRWRRNGNASNLAYSFTLYNHEDRSSIESTGSRPTYDTLIPNSTSGRRFELPYPPDRTLTFDVLAKVSCEEKVTASRLFKELRFVEIT